MIRTITLAAVGRSFPSVPTDESFQAAKPPSNQERKMNPSPNKCNHWRNNPEKLTRPAARLSRSSHQASGFHWFLIGLNQVRRPQFSTRGAGILMRIVVIPRGIQVVSEAHGFIYCNCCIACKTAFARARQEVWGRFSDLGKEPTGCEGVTLPWCLRRQRAGSSGIWRTCWPCHVGGEDRIIPVHTAALWRVATGRKGG